MNKKDIKNILLFIVIIGLFISNLYLIQTNNRVNDYKTPTLIRLTLDDLKNGVECYSRIDSNIHGGVNSDDANNLFGSIKKGDSTNPAFKLIIENDKLVKETYTLFRDTYSTEFDVLTSNNTIYASSNNNRTLENLIIYMPYGQYKYAGFSFLGGGNTYIGHGYCKRT